MVDVGVGLVERVGAKALSLTAVARSAGVARATAYRMFGGRDALVAAIVDREVANLRDRLLRWAADEPDASAKVRAQILHVLPYIRDHEALQYVLRREPEEIVRALIATDTTPGPTLIGRIVDATVADVEPETAAQLLPDPRGAAEFLVRVIYSLMLVPDGVLDDEQVADLIVRAIVAEPDETPGAPASPAADEPPTSGH